MLLRDADGRTFDAKHLESVLERYDDAALGEVARVRLTDGSHRLVRFAELELAAKDETVDSTFFASWPTWPSAG